MLYPKNQDKRLSDQLFANPTSEYRAAPFWAWNCDLNKELLETQIGYLKEMGFGGFHMHARTGLSTPYLGEDFAELIRTCVDKAEREEMLAWLYDEDRWPSGFAGGLVTKDIRFRQRMLCFGLEPPSDQVDAETAIETGRPCSIGAYDVYLDKNGFMSRYERAGDNPCGQGGMRWYAALLTRSPEPWFNNQGYVDTLNPEAMQRFIELTYEFYKKTAGDRFGGTVPAIFTDEPQFARKDTLDRPDRLRNVEKTEAVSDARPETPEVLLPWTPDFRDSFCRVYGYDIADRLPELFFDLPNGQVSQARYHYHDHVAERFATAFADQCGAWCDRNGLMLTGHMMGESTLEQQTLELGEAMRSYRSFQLPGIDMLCDKVELSTSKQAQSAVRQYGRPGMASELYGVTDWDFDFRGHKFQGDWQAAMGVTVRVPHLSWVSMHGEAKRDYPASINYQSAWFREYSYVENHFARLNAALTRGKAITKVAVIHPVESYWLYWGPKLTSGAVREQLEERFQSVIQWLLYGGIDFDFISESLLPSQCSKSGAPLKVGEMEYDAVIVPGCITLRNTTVTILNSFAAQGGALIFAGACPSMVDAVPTDSVRPLYEAAITVSFDRNSILGAIEPWRLVDLRNADSSRTDNLLYQLRDDNGSRWLFIAQGKKYTNVDVSRRQEISVSISGLWRPTVYNTLDGSKAPIGCVYENDKTVIAASLYSYDSLLLYLEPGMCADQPAQPNPQDPVWVRDIRTTVPYTLSEPNVLLLDQAEFALNDEAFRPTEEILRLDNVLRADLGYPPRTGAVPQPWTQEKETPVHTASLRFTIESEVALDSVELALEDADRAKIQWNGETVASRINGWYVDECIKTVQLPGLRKGTNTLIITLPFGRTTNLEWCYLLGGFGVRVAGCVRTITAPAKELGFASVVEQGLPYYGGAVTYHTWVETDCAGELAISVPHYRGAVVRVAVDGQDAGVIAYDPYEVRFPVTAGKHQVDLTLFGTRFNSFGALHNADSHDRWIGSRIWRKTETSWCYEYRTRDMGITGSPVFRLYSDKK